MSLFPVLLSFCLVEQIIHTYSISTSAWCFRFALDIDFDAPKVRIPIGISGSSKCDSHLLLDFGHFMLHTKVHMDLL